MWALIAVMVTLAAGTWAGSAHGAEYAAQYVVFEVDEYGLVEPVFHRFVELSEAPRTKSEREVQSALARDRSGNVVTLELRDDNGVPIFRDAVRSLKWVRGEFHGETRPDGSSEIESFRAPLARRVFVVRLPVLTAGSLVVDAPGRSVFDLQEISRMPMALELPDSLLIKNHVRAGQRSGNPANRVDVLIMGDGYTAAQEADFNADVTTFQNGFFGISPYGDYENYVNITSLFTASAESGADHPPYNASCSSSDLSCCADSLASSDPSAGTFVNTAFNAHYCTSNIHRLLDVNDSLVLTAASAVPDWDQILVIVNDDTYGGSGGSIAVASTHGQAVDVVRHEYGHSFTDLADEYDSPFPGFPGCNDLSSPPCEANVTNATSLIDIKWAPWILPGTPVPTPESNPTYTNAVGLFEGARYLSSGIYRPRDTQCLMHFLGQSFGEVCAQEYVRVLYNGGWGVPASGIELIEPGTEVPTPGTINDCTVAFSSVLLGPSGGPAIAVEWSVDGVPVPGETSNSYAFSPQTAGSYDVELRVEDTTPLVHPEMAGSDLITSRQWTVDCGCNIIPVPMSVEPLRLTSTDLLWTSVGYAMAYDVVRGDLNALRASSGAFDTSTDPCLQDDLQGTSLPYTDDPLPGQGHWFLVRGANCGGSGTFDAGGVSQSGVRMRRSRRPSVPVARHLAGTGSRKVLRFATGRIFGERPASVRGSTVACLPVPSRAAHSTRRTVRSAATASASRTVAKTA